MKKFISWVAAVAVLVSVMSCREAEELTAVPETNYHANAKLKNDSLDEKQKILRQIPLIQSVKKRVILQKKMKLNGKISNVN